MSPKDLHVERIFPDPDFLIQIFLCMLISWRSSIFSLCFPTWYVPGLRKFLMVKHWYIVKSVFFFFFFYSSSSNILTCKSPPLFSGIIYYCIRATPCSIGLASCYPVPILSRVGSCTYVIFQAQRLFVNDQSSRWLFSEIHWSCGTKRKNLSVWMSLFTSPCSCGDLLITLLCLSSLLSFQQLNKEKSEVKITKKK